MLLDRLHLFFKENYGRATALVLVLFLSPSFLLASPEKANQVSLAQCQLDFCVQLSTDKLYKSVMSRSYAFGPSSLIVTQKGESALELKDFEGTFDAKEGRFYLSKESLTYDLVIDTQKGKIYRLTRS